MTITGLSFKPSAQAEKRSWRRSSARFLVAYRIAGKEYQITLPGVSASHVRSAWDRPGSVLLRVEECDEHGMPVT